MPGREEREFSNDMQQGPRPGTLLFMVRAATPRPPGCPKKQNVLKTSATVFKMFKSAPRNLDNII